MTGITSTSSQTAKERLLNIKTIGIPTDHMIGGYHCIKEQYDEWITAPLRKQLELEVEWGFKWRKDTSYAEAVGTKEPEVALSVEATLAQRGSRYGDFTDHAKICQDLKDVMVNSSVNMPDLTTTTESHRERRWHKLTPVQKQALEVIADKIARILSGDPNYDDNWHDIQGYAKLVEDRLPKKEA